MPFYMIVPETDRYRWLGRKTDAEGLTLAKVRHAPVAGSWKPIGVEWLPETKGRPTCDFPIFTSIVRCMSNRAASRLHPFLAGNVELLALEGVEGYIGVHCINWVDAADMRDVDQNCTSIASTMFLPKLKGDIVASLHVFGVPQMIAKMFVSVDVKRAVEESKLTGLEFHEVELT